MGKTFNKKGKKGGTKRKRHGGGLMKLIPRKIGYKKYRIVYPGLYGETKRNAFYEGNINWLGMRNGQGTFVSRYGDIYEGEWKNDKMNGQGKFTFTNGDVYDGEWKNGLKSGKGKFTFTNGDVYDGEWKNDKMNGQGLYTSANGHVYKGEWKDDNFHGRGKNTYANGHVYDGEWKNDEKDGQGVMTYANGDVYDGEWKDNKKNGLGTMKFTNGIYYEGEWEKGYVKDNDKITYIKPTKEVSRSNKSRKSSIMQKIRIGKECKKNDKNKNDSEEDVIEDVLLEELVENKYIKLSDDYCYSIKSLIGLQKNNKEEWLSPYRLKFNEEDINLIESLQSIAKLPPGGYPSIHERVRPTGTGSGSS
jgi:hypothetical protein